MRSRKIVGWSEETLIDFSFFFGSPRDAITHTKPSPCEPSFQSIQVEKEITDSRVS
jgi:hypothetical protein